MNRKEFVKLIELIKENKLVNKDSLLMIRYIFDSNMIDENKLTNEQKEIIVKLFIDLKRKFNKRTLNFILENSECIRVAIKNDINSVKYVREENIDSELEDEIIDEVKKCEFILSKDSPNFICRNFLIVKKSVMLNIKSADYVDWFTLTEQESEELIKILLDKEYKLHAKSNMFLKNNVEIVLRSLKENINNINYASELIKEDSQVFKYLLEHGYEFSKNEILDRPLSDFKDEKILKIALNKIGGYTSNDKKYQERMTKLYKDIINSELKISDFDEAFKYNSEELWDIEKRENMHMYNNIFAKICAELRNYETFQLAVYSLDFLEQMESVLKERYYDLFVAMKEYYRISHSDISNKIEKLEPYKNEIARLSALYISKSKDYFINEGLEVMREFLYPYFELNLNNLEIYKKLVLEKQMKYFRKEYQKEGTDVYKNVYEIIDEYKNTIDYQLVKDLVQEFILYNNKNNVMYLIKMPKNYQEYVRYVEADKLIKRLNNGYIKYDSCEVINYQDIIVYDGEKYKYTGMLFNNINEFKEYERKLRLYKDLKKKIIFKVKEIKFEDEIDEDLIGHLADTVDFNDKYFNYMQNKTLEMITFRQLVYVMFGDMINLNRILNDSEYELIYEIFVNKRLMWCFMMGQSMFYRGADEINLDCDKVSEMVGHLDKLMKIAKNFKFDLRKIKDLWLVYMMNQYATSSDLAIIGEEIVSKLIKDVGFTSEKVEDIIRIAKELVCNMVERSKSTVPYVSGKYLNYCYSLYDSQDNSILTSGIDTDACFRVDGVDNDFFHYCVLDKNGFVIKITDELGNFVARASGFRNGNCVFINQLRTIYDQSGNDYLNDYDNESNEIIDTFKKACRDIVETSLNNSDEEKKIEYVFVTKSYCLEKCQGNVSDEVTNAIGTEPEESESEDWENFVNNTNNLEMNSIYGTLGTDYGQYSLLCVTAIKHPEEIKVEDIKRGDVPAVYERNRSKITAVKNCDEEVIKKLNKIKAIVCYFEGRDYQPVEVLDNSLVIYGDNWYLIYQDCEIIDECLLFDDKAAVRELQASIDVMEQLYQDKLMVSANLIGDAIGWHLKKVLKKEIKEK